MSKNRPVLKAPRAPKGNDIDAVLKFIQEQKQKPSEAAAAAKKLTKISKDSKNREKRANQASSFMKELRKVTTSAQNAKQLTTSSLINLSENLPELPDILKHDAKLQADCGGDVVHCQSFLDRLQNLNVRERNPQTNNQYKEIREEFMGYLSTLELPEQYDAIVEIVEKTKLPPPEKAKFDYSSKVNEEWRAKIDETVAAFAKVENEIRMKNREWLIENGYDPDAKYGGWDDLEHQRFLLTNCGEITIEFERTPEEIISHKKWYIKQQFMKKRIDAIRVELQSRIEKMIEECREEEARREEQRLYDLEVKERQRALSEDKAELNEKLKIEREEKRKRDEEKRQREEQERKLKEEEEMRQRALSQKEKAELKKKVLTEKEKRKAQEERIRKLRLEEAERQKELLKERRKEMQAVVSGRRQIDEKKRQMKEEELKKKQEEEMEKQKRLDMLAQQVKDEFGLDDLVADPEKPTKLTEIRRAAEKEERSMFSLTSFASSVIENDPRIRMENALREAGLLNSPYAMNVINQMAALRPLPGMESQIKF